MTVDSNKQIWMKLVEELNELSTVLIQHYNKPDKDLSSEIIDEFGDVIFQMQRVKENSPQDVIDLIDKRVAWKKAKYKLKRKFNSEWPEEKS